ncbi:hypothetical protein [Intestinibacter bartlettii]|uniref:hypothetical protein n=1 Tax=Intestinibacter bartlettii TaxID=261299 RepID=UPI00321BC5C2
MGMYKGRITKIEKEQFTSCSLTQNIKGKDQPYYDNSSKYNGSNGTYTSNYHTDYFVYLYLTIYGKQPESNQHVKIDIRQKILDKNNLKRISSKKINQIKNDNVGNKVSFDIINGYIIFDHNALKL